MAAITKDQLENASLDAESLSDVVNGPDNAIVTTRLGQAIKTLARVIKELSEQDIGAGAAALINQRVGASAPRIDDWNSITKTGWYRGTDSQGTTIGAPAPNAQMVVNHMQGAGNRAWQIAFLPVSGTPPRLWIRYQTSTNVWGEWFELSTEANAGLFAPAAIVSEDYNSITKSGVYRSTGSTVGRPSPEFNSVILHTEGLGGRGYQLAQWATESAEPHMAFRYRTTGNVWGEWHELSTEESGFSEITAGDPRALFLDGSEGEIFDFTSDKLTAFTDLEDPISGAVS